MPFEYTEYLRKDLDTHVGDPRIESGASLRDSLKSLDAIRDKQMFPARFQLLRFIEAQPHVREDRLSYTVAGARSGREYRLPRLDALESVHALEEEQLCGCVDYLTERALSLDARARRNERYYKNVFNALIRKNLWMRYRESDQRYLNKTFDRRCAYEMGHALGFSYEQMTDFLIRVLPDEIFKNRDAENLVEGYCFRNGLDQEDARQMLEEYAKRKKDAPSCAPVEGENTLQIYSEAVAFKGTRQDFVAWLAGQSALLDSRSETAFRLYRNLLICAYLMIQVLYENKDARHKDAFEKLWTLWDECMEDATDMCAYYDAHHLDYDLPPFGRLDWDKVSREFRECSDWAPFENRERRYPRDFLLYLTLDQEGNFKTENTYSRIPAIMRKREPVQKRDILCMLWQIYIFTGAKDPCADGFEEDEFRPLSETIHEFIDLAKGVLGQCGFAFYLPNMLEYSICRSLAMGGDMEDAYVSLVRRDGELPLCEDVCILDNVSHNKYAVRFYTCGKYTYQTIYRELYAKFQNEISQVNNYSWNEIELWIKEVDQDLQCGWERIDSKNLVAQLSNLGREIELPPAKGKAN